MQPGPFEAEFDESSQTLVVAGEVDEAAALVLRDAIEKGTDGYARPLVVDLSRVSFLPSTAVGVLAAALQRGSAGAHAIELVAAEDTIARRVLTVCALPHRTA